MENSPAHQWPRMAQAVNEAAVRLQPHYGEAGIPSDVLAREAERLGGYGRGSIVPADYCYNAINKAPYSFRYPLLLRVERGRYKYVGPHYAYTGPVMWQPKQGSERQVGSWTEGEFDLNFDPRVESC